jgi:aspartyl-tRNA(Asn)/glutamyl-tRNA(Gln) amidotransferase subunit A
MRTIKEIANMFASKEISAVELTTEYLERNKALQSKLNTNVSLDEDAALAMAREADVVIERSEATPLTGVPFGVKDAICTKGMRSTGSARILDSYVPPFDATVIGRLRAQHGVIVGKHNCDGFGHGSSTENSHYGVSKNPWDVTRVPGGSSGGSSAAVAADLCVYAIAEDTGGSIRYPAALTGVVGFRPSYGRNSRYGIMPMASSLDVVGPMAHTVEDVALIMEVMAGQDTHDATAVPDAVPKYSQEIQGSVRGMRIGIPKEYFGEGIAPDVAKAVEEAIRVYTSLGCTIQEVSLPHTKYAIAAYYILVPCEDSSNLARMDGMRYGVRGSGSLLETYISARNDGFPDEVKRRIMIGTHALSAGYYDAYYHKAQQVRTRIIEDFTHAWESVDVLLTPTSATTAFKIGEKSNDPLAMYLTDAFVSPASIAGVPGLSVPCGFDRDGLPVGLQIIGPRMAESRVLQFGHQYQLVTDWHTRVPHLE